MTDSLMVAVAPKPPADHLREDDGDDDLVRHYVIYFRPFSIGNSFSSMFMIDFFVTFCMSSGLEYLNQQVGGSGSCLCFFRIN